MWGLARSGDCEPPVPDNVGKYMRKLVIGSIRAAAERGANASAAAAAGPAGGNAPGLFPGASDDSAAGGEEDIYGENEKDELNICCHGRAAAPEVRPRFLGAAVRHLPAVCSRCEGAPRHAARARDASPAVVLVAPQPGPV